MARGYNARGRSLSEMRPIDRDAARRAGCRSERDDLYDVDPRDELISPDPWPEVYRFDDDPLLLCPQDGTELVAEGNGLPGWSCVWSGHRYLTNPVTGEEW